MTNPQERRKATVFEQHAQSVVGAVILAVLLWVGNTLTDVKEKQIKMEGVLLGQSALQSSLESRISRAEGQLHEVQVDLAKRRP